MSWPKVTPWAGLELHSILALDPVLDRQLASGTDGQRAEELTTDTGQPSVELSMTEHDPQVGRQQKEELGKRYPGLPSLMTLTVGIAGLPVLELCSNDVAAVVARRPLARDWFDSSFWSFLTCRT